ncbi:protein yellow-like isoform X2 [Cimex lectularius]|uniref:Bee-milk protein n=1 Tax=Cimex lectularius TaxID=79782 RepID=A0A8I6SKD1_CIMLE|nr:protein yellow-like isoform X2 [Cimex lectularius]
MNEGIGFGLFLILSASIVRGQWLTVTHIWWNVDFEFPTEFTRRSALMHKELIPDTVVIIDADVYKGRLFVTTPSLMPGTPATLSTVDQFTSVAPLLRPFPDWSWHNVTDRNDCSYIKSVFRIKIDKLGRLWVVDSGVTNAFSDRTIRGNCNPKIMVFDLNDEDRLIRMHVIDKILIDDDSLLLNIAVQVMNEDGENTFAYIADSMGTRLIVYDYAKDRVFIHQHPYFFPDPAYGFYKTNGVQYTVMDGLFTLAIDEKRDLLYFHALSSGHESRVKASILRNETITERQAREFEAFPKRPFHASSEVITDRGLLVFPSLEHNELLGWDTTLPYETGYFHLLARDEEALQFPTGMKLAGDLFLMVTTRLQNLLANGMANKGEINYRILVGDARYLDKFLYKKR